MLFSPIFRIRRGWEKAGFFIVHSGTWAVKTGQCLLLLRYLLDARLPLLGLLKQLLLVLLLAQAVQELVWLRQDLGNEGVLVVILDVEYLPTHFVVLQCCLVNIAHQVFVLQVNPPKLLVVVDVLIICWRLLSTNDLIHVATAYFSGWQNTWLRSIVDIVDLASWAHSPSKSVRWRRPDRILLYYFPARQVDLLCCEEYIWIIVDIIWVWLGICSWFGLEMWRLFVFFIGVFQPWEIAEGFVAIDVQVVWLLGIEMNNWTFEFSIFVDILRFAAFVALDRLEIFAVFVWLGSVGFCPLSSFDYRQPVLLRSS